MNNSFQTVPSENRDHWQIHNTKQIQVDVNFSRTSELWKWAQVRLASYPTTEQNKYIYQLHSLDENESSYGDLTVMISKIIPIQIQKPFLPNGFLRAWDGSGSPISDR